jgi:adenylate cyclase
LAILKTKNHGLLYRIILVLIAPAITMALFHFGHLERLGLVAYDLLYSLRGEVRPDDRIVLVKQDEASTNYYNIRLSDWPRSYHAKLIAKLNEAGADLIVFDYDFSRPTSESDDSAFAKAIYNAENIILANRLLRSGKIAQPLGSFTEGSLGEGFIDALLDPDGSMRRMIYMSLTRDGYIYFSLPMTTVEIYENFPVEQRVLDDPDALGWGQHRLPYPDMLINFAGPENSYPSISYYKVLENKFNARDVEGKIVLVGNTHRLGKDHFTVPTDTRMSGLEVHANAIATILGDTYISPLPRTALILFIVLAGIIGGTLIFRNRASLYSSFLLAFAGTAAIILSAYLLFITEQVWMDTVPLLLTFLANISIATGYQWKLSKNREREIRGLFGHYVSKNVVDAILSENIPIKLDGHRTEVTILFSDIRGFTSISEALSPSELGHLLNVYFDEMIAAVFNHDGTLDKLMGDAVMAFFGSPLESRDHQDQACRCALEMIERLDALNNSGRLPRGIQIEIRIGLHTGDGIVGNLGSSDFADYTVIGDAVNLASRIEGLNKRYDTRIIISEDTWRSIHGTHLTRELDTVRVKGKLEPKNIYELIIENTGITSNTIEIYQNALQKYRAGDWQEAYSKCAELAEKTGDGPAARLADKCRELIENPPGPGWEAVSSLTEK